MWRNNVYDKIIPIPQILLFLNKCMYVESCNENISPYYVLSALHKSLQLKTVWINPLTAGAAYIRVFIFY